MQRIQYTAISLGLFALLNGCGGSSSTESTASTSTSSDVSNLSSTTSTDITNVTLTNRSANCEDYVKSYSSQVTDIQNDTDFKGSLTIEISNGKCVFTSNMIPNHDFNDASASFHETVEEQSSNVEIPVNPTFASKSTTIELADNGIYLNGVALNLLSAGCYGVADGQIGCGDLNMPFRSDPMYNRGFGVDIHNAHVQPGGKYHYHGSPVALFDTSGVTESPVIGFAKDGFPIFGSYVNDAGSIRKVTSSYVLKSGSRSAVTYNGTTYDPGGTYTGEYTSDWEYVEGVGDLDECNGMAVNGVYGYYVIDTYPWVMNCYKGTPDSLFGR